MNKGALIYEDYINKGYIVKCLDLSGYVCPDKEIDTIKIIDPWRTVKK